MNRVYSGLKVFGFPDHLTSRPDSSVRPPVHIRIKPINACNHHCWFCAYRADNLELGADMDLRDRIPRKKIDEIVDDIISLGVRAVTFSGGGEPLLYPGIAEVVARLGKGGVAVATLTNGTYLQGAIADAFATYGTWVRVSMDGWDDESYQRHRKTKPGEFERITGNVRAFASRGSACEIGISFIVTQENAPHVFAFCALAKSLGARHVKLSACIVGNSAAENDAYHGPIARTVREQIERARSLDDEGFEVVDHYHGFDDRFYKTYVTCPMLDYLTVIGADCLVYSCQDKAYSPSGILGSIKERSFGDFWFSAENQARMREIDPRRDCLHHCVSHAKNQLLTEYRELDPRHLLFV